MMNILSSLRRAAGAALVAGLAATATPALADDYRIDDAWKAALEEADGVLTDKQHALINSIAYHAAAAQLCDGIDIDEPEVTKAVASVIADTPKELLDAQQVERMTTIVLMLGTAKGIILAEGALHKADFCASAMQEKADAQYDHFWKP
jgi:hypothetical protein